MLHARNDYNERIQDTAEKIGPHEPVFLLRAQDALMVPMLYHYLDLLRQDPDHDNTAEIGTLRHIERAIDWQVRQGPDVPKRPDTPPAELR